MTEKDKISLILGAGLGFLAWYLMRGNTPAIKWTVNPASGRYEPVQLDRWATGSIPFETSITPVETLPLVTEYSRLGPPPAPYVSWEAYDRARWISGNTGGASGNW